MYTVYDNLKRDICLSLVHANIHPCVYNYIIFLNMHSYTIYLYIHIHTHTHIYSTLVSDKAKKEARSVVEFVGNRSRKNDYSIIGKF